MSAKKCTAIVIAAVGAVASIALAEGEVPFVPTPIATVEAMLQAADVGPEDFVIDLGSGDGRIVIAAAQQFGAKGLGVDLDRDLIMRSRRKAALAGVSDRVEFRRQDLYQTDLGRATVLTLYLLPEVNLRLRDKILNEMKPGSRVVSHDYDMGDWQPDMRAELGTDVIYLWIVPARVEGSWSFTVGGQDGARQAEIHLEQDYQAIRGSIVANGRSVPLREALLFGDLIALGISDPDSGQTMMFQGKVNGFKIEGALEGEPAVMERQALSSQIEL